MSSNSSHLREFDRFRLDLGKKVLWYGDEPVHVPAKAVEVLCELVERRGEIVTKGELLDRVWQDSFVEESVLPQNIHLLRKTFKDFNVKENPIQTIPRRGYRFAGEVHPVEHELLFEHEIVERGVLTEISEGSLPNLGFRAGKSSTLHTRRSYSLILVAIAAAIIVAVAAVVAWRTTAPAESAGVNGIGSIAVLPLKPLNEVAENRTLALGLTDSLIARLGRQQKLAVRPFSAVDKYEQSGKDAIAFGKELRVDTVAEGTVQRSDDRLRVNLRLLDVRSGSQIWADTFDEPESDVLALQDVISRRVAKAIFARLDPLDEELIAKSPTANKEAYRLYLAGREAWLRRDGQIHSLSFYQKAIELDPNFALPYLGIADEFAFTYETQRAEDALSRALDLDPYLHEAHATRGFLQMFHYWDWQGAENSFQRALELAPNSSKAHHWYGVYLSMRGRLDEATREMEKALELDPSALVIMTDIAELHYFKRDYERAQSELENVTRIDPNFSNARTNLIKVRHKNGASYFLEEAEFNVFRQKKMAADGLAPEFDVRKLEALVTRKNEQALRDNHLKSLRAAANSKREAFLGLSKFYAVTGEAQKSLDALERAIDAKVFVTPFVSVDPLWDSVRNEPRFRQLLQRMNLT